MDLLTDAVTAFNNRRYTAAAELTAQGMRTAVGRDELFWIGLHEACQAFEHIADNKLAPAEGKLVAAMEKLRHFGYRYQNLEVTSVLAGLRRGLEEARAVRSGQRRMFDVSLLPQIKMAAKAKNL
ncbi:hypothetical protein KKG45_02775 [bacterium]|nr:hypothetical protein [bacterium]MBU1072147.1 hypothetical protein [bacterium]MBU1676147.1 hypothetical protein [bacterium]